jgi:uncharacterized protein YcbX
MPLTLSAIYVYPVKGLQGIALDAARCTARGLEHDRRWMVVDEDGAFLSQRVLPRMATIWTDMEGGKLALAAAGHREIDVPLEPDFGEPVRVTVWNSECDAIAPSAEADAWLSTVLGRFCRLVYMPERTRRESPAKYAGPGRLVGFADAFAYLLVGESSLADLNARLIAKQHGPLPMNRFRPNLVVSGAAPYAEDGWRELRAGEAMLTVARPCGRCQVTTTDQATGEVRGPEPLATLASFRNSPELGPMFGVNLVTSQPGAIRVGQPVEATT